METFFILLLIVFVPFIWYIVRMLRYTDDTVGENSPLYRERTYQVSASSYFGSFDKLLYGAVFVQMLFLSWILLREAIKLHNPILFVFLLFFTGFAGYIVYVFYVYRQYWTITKDVLLTLNPFDPSIRVDSPNQIATLTPENMTRIELHLRQSSNSKEPLYGLGYYLFYQSDGTVVRINRSFFIHTIEFLERYFSMVPSEIIWHKLPPILPISAYRN